MRMPWWAVPGAAAVVGTVAVVTFAQGPLSSGVALPRSVQLAVPHAPRGHTATTVPLGTAPAGTCT